MTARFRSVYHACPVCGSEGIGAESARSYGDLHLTWSQCRSCGLVFQNPPLTPEAVRDAYQKQHYFAKAYGDYTAKDNIRIAQSHKRLDLIERFAPPGRTLLDVGSASGFFGRAATSRGYRVTCIEPDEQLARYGRDTYGLDMRATTLEDCELEPNSFDVVTVWGTDSHFVHPLHSHRKLADALRPGGLFAMNYQAFDHWLRRVPFFSRIKTSWNVIYHFTDRSFDCLLSRIGLELAYRRKTEWQRTTIGHAIRQMHWEPPRFIDGIEVTLPSYRIAVARKASSTQ